jgi:predicted aldo/keto reductase-like oxidoreductase
MFDSTSSRRSFVKQLGAAGIGLAALSQSARAQAKDSLAAAGKNIRNFKPTMKYRQIGNTGVYASAFSIGTTRGELAAISAGVDKGVNFIHTSANYMGGAAIGMVAQATKGRADKVHIALKDSGESFESTVKALGVPYADFVMFPRHDPDALKTELPDIKKRYLELRDKKLVKFAGLTFHKNIAAIMDIALETDFLSCVMPSYGPSQITELAKHRDALRKKGMSIVAMKTKGELDDAAYPAQITAALGDSVVATVCRGVKTMEELESWSAAANKAQTGWLNTDDGTRVAANYLGCNMCGKCEGACPNSVATADIVRCVRYYHQAERDPQLAAAMFAEMGLAKDLARCTNCGLCDEACPQRLGVRLQLDRGRRLWGSAVA